MKIYRILLFTAALFLSVSCDDYVYVETETENTISEELQLNLKSHLRKTKADNRNYPGGFALQVLYPGGEAFVTAGLDDAGNTIHFRAASNTKTLTSTAILLLAERGRIDLNQKITNTMPKSSKTYLPDGPEYAIPFKDEITILQLLQHRAGVFDVSNFNVPDTVTADVRYKGKNYVEFVLENHPSHTFTFEELISVNATCGLYDFKPGTGYHYSNTGYSILGKIIERVSGKTYGQFIRDEILEPMGMRSSSMPEAGNEQQLPQPFASGYVQLKDEVINTTESNISANVAEGNLVTTPVDLAKFLRSLLRGEGVLSSTWVNSVMMNVMPTQSVSNSAYGCGITYTNNLGYGHNGAHAGYLSQMVYDPQTDITLVIFTNVWDVTDGLTSIGKQMSGLQEVLYQSKQIITDHLRN